MGGGSTNVGVGSNPTSDTMLHIEIRLPVLLCAVKTVEGDFRFCINRSMILNVKVHAI